MGTPFNQTTQFCHSQYLFILFTMHITLQFLKTLFEINSNNIYSLKFKFYFITFTILSHLGFGYKSIQNHKTKISYKTLRFQLKKQSLLKLNGFELFCMLIWEN